MSPTELQDWLLDNGISEELELITRASVVPELGSITNSNDDASNLEALDWPRLLLAGSVLARSDRRRPIEAALRIATAAISLDTSEQIKDAGAVLLQKLSNYRAADLAEQRELVKPGLESRLGVLARLEASARSLEDSILIDHSGERLHVNHFQQSFWTEANKDKTWISASAPTASGKTFLILQWLLDQLQNDSTKIAIYLAPTRALVNEIEEGLNARIKKDKIENVEITSLPLADKYNDAIIRKKKAIFVFTQERLHLLANVLNDDFKVDLLIADEAHKIGDNLRGVVLQDALERMVRLNPGMKQVFISPATQNPEILLEDAPDSVNKRPVDSDSPTVLQNLVLARQRSGRTKEWLLNLRQPDGGEMPIGTLMLETRPTSVGKKLAAIAAAAGKKGGTLVYTNGASEAEDVASLISQLIDNGEGAKDAELLALSDLARRGVHESYLLAPLVLKGVAFHYGNMPSLLREEIERLFRAGKIKFLTCTSTLIEGVNLSCRTIVVRGPRKGKGNPMEPHDFWNLAGRAGRWGNEFQGNIICVDPQNAVAWPIGVPYRKRYPIQRETDAVLSGQSVDEYIRNRKDRAVADLSQASQMEQVCAYLLTTFLREGTIISAPFARRHDKQFIASLDKDLTELAAAITLPAEIAVRHSGVNPFALQNLLNHFTNYDGNVEDLLPAAPESDDAYVRLTRIMKAINEHIFPAFFPATIIPLHTLVVLEWLKGYSLASIIRERIKYNTKHGRSFKLPALIRSTMEMVESVARFRAPKYLSAYMDVLKIHLARIGKSHLIAPDLDVGVQLEFGVSTRTLLSLMELGLSRMSAVAINERIAPDNLTREEARKWVEDHNSQFEGMEISPIILSEVRRKILGIEG